MKWMKRIGDWKRFPDSTQGQGIRTRPQSLGRNMPWVRGACQAIRSYASEAVYINFLGDESDERVRAACGAEKYERLVVQKKR